MARARKPASKAGAGELTPAQLNEIWEQAQPWMGISDVEYLESSLSGDNAAAARSNLFWLAEILSVAELSPEDDLIRGYALRALETFFKGNVTLGRAFGVERAQKGPKPVLPGAIAAISGLVRYLHDRCGYPLSESKSTTPTAFEVASVLVEKKMGKKLKPGTLEDKYWAPRRRKRVALRKAPIA